MNEYLLFFSRTSPLLLKGALMTLQVLLCASLISFTLGLIFGVFSCKKLYIPFISSFIEGLCFILRAIPFMVQLLLVYFVFPDIFHYNLEPFPAAVLSLGLCSCGYTAQIIRSAINNLAQAQWETAFCLGYSTFESLIHIILPQVYKNILPACTNELDSLLKSTAIVSSIGLLELTRIGMNIVSREMQPIPTYLTIAFFYVCISAAINYGIKNLEKKASYVKY